MSPRGTARPSRGRSTDLPIEGLPIVAVVGRPNVGKSTLFNRVLGERHAVVEDRARTTRDRLYAATEWNGRRFVIVDTGGLERHPGDSIEEKVQDQARVAIGEADVIVFVVDAAAGETPADQEAAEILRTAPAPVLVAANKADNEKRELEAAEFHRLGWPETYAISALHGRGVADLLDAIVWALPPESEAERDRKRREARAEEEAEFLAEGFDAPLDARAATGGGNAWSNELQVGDESGLGRLVGPEDDEFGLEDEGLGQEDGLERKAGGLDRRRRGRGGRAPVQGGPEPGRGDALARIAIVGRPNVGKSSLLNKLLGEERTIVSDIPGTTRDAIDTALDWNGVPIRIVDTAGLRRRGKIASGPAAERFSSLRAIRAVGRADVAVLVLDAMDGLTAQDAHVAGYVLEEGTGLVLALNKWDLVEKSGRTFDEYIARIRAESPFLDFAPIVAISALTGQRVGRVLDAALDIAIARRRRIATAELNRVLAEATYRQPAPTVHGRRPRLYYATQAGVQPPTFVLFASDAAGIHFSYKRYLENRLRETFDFAGSPIRLIFRERSRVQLEPRRKVNGRPADGRRSASGGAKASKAARPAKSTAEAKSPPGAKPARSAVAKPARPAAQTTEAKPARSAKPTPDAKPARSAKLSSEAKPTPDAKPARPAKSSAAAKPATRARTSEGHAGHRSPQ